MVPRRRELGVRLTLFAAGGRPEAVVDGGSPGEAVAARRRGARVAVGAAPAVDWRTRRRGG